MNKIKNLAVIRGEVSKYKQQKLAANTQTLDQLAVPVIIFGAQILGQTVALTDQNLQTTLTVLVFFVAVQVSREVVDAVRQHCHLNLGAARVALERCVIFNDCCLVFCTK